MEREEVEPLLLWPPHEAPSYSADRDIKEKRKSEIKT